MRAEPSGPALWWAAPSWCLLLVVPASLALAQNTSDADFRTLYRTPRTLSVDDVGLFALAGAVLLLGVLLGQALAARQPPAAWPGLSERQITVLERAATVLFRLTVVGYLAFAAVGLRRGVTLEQLTGPLLSQTNYSGELRLLFAPVTGVTTMTQFGVAYVVVAGLQLSVGSRRGVSTRLAVVLGLSLLRSFYVTERLALLEVLVPFLLVLAVRRRATHPALTAAAPALAVPALVVVFGLFEYSRSWVYFRTRTTGTYSQFVVDRLAGYYATAYNNGAVGLHQLTSPERLPYASLEALWTAPVVGQLQVYQRLSGGIDPAAESRQLLSRFASPEFTNPCGLCTPLIDFGLAPGLLFLLLAGAAVGALYAGFRTGGPLGLLLYPVAFTGLLEVPRYLYWTQGRTVPAIVGLSVLAVLLRRAADAPSFRDTSLSGGVRSAASR